MIRKMFGSMLVLAIAFGFVAAGEYQARITKVNDDGSVMVQKLKGKGKKVENDGDPVKMKLAKGAKIISSKFDADAKKVVDGDDLPEGLKNEVFSKIGDKGVGVLVVTEGEGDKEEITKLRVQGKKKKAAAE